MDNTTILMLILIAIAFYFYFTKKESLRNTEDYARYQKLIFG